MKGNTSKGHTTYITWEEEHKRSSSNSCSSLDDECANLYLMTRKKGKTSKVYTSNSNNEYSYSELFKEFNDMCADSINAFKKNSL